MIREKRLIRKQITLAIERQDYAAAQRYMSVICKDEMSKKPGKWSKDEEEFLLNHIKALGVNEACERVAKKLNRSKSSIRTKYYALMRKERKNNASTITTNGKSSR